MIAFLIQKFFDISDFLDLFGRSFDNPNRAIDRQGNSLSWQMSHHTGQSFHSAIFTIKIIMEILRNRKVQVILIDTFSAEIS